MVFSRIKKGSTYCGKGEVMVASLKKLITLGIWEYQRIQQNREMMVALSEQLTVAKVGLCDLTAH